MLYVNDIKKKKERNQLRLCQCYKLEEQIRVYKDSSYRNICDLDLHPTPKIAKKSEAEKYF